MRVPLNPLSPALLESLRNIGYNGHGMTRNQIIEAMHSGSRNPLETSSPDRQWPRGKGGVTFVR
jgi:hypothetical protein